MADELLTEPVTDPSPAGLRERIGRIMGKAKEKISVWNEKYEAFMKNSLMEDYSTPATAEPKSLPESAKNAYYQAGLKGQALMAKTAESVRTIAEYNQRLMELNDLTEEKAKKLATGTKLKLPQ